MLTRETLFGTTDLVEVTIERIKDHAQAALEMNSSGYWVAFSGGKYSIVLLDLVRRAAVEHTAHFNVTTVDPPELLRFLREHYPDVSWERPEKSMFQLIIEYMIPPTARMRYCCAYLKERGGNGQFVLTGIRRAESHKRSTRRMVHRCNTRGFKVYLNPLIDWTDQEIWTYIRQRGLPYPPLYDEGFTRVGCVGCPLSGTRGMRRYFARWPRYENAYRKAMEIAVRRGWEEGHYERRRRKNPKRALSWPTGDAMFDWWVTGADGAGRKKAGDNQELPLEFAAEKEADCTIMPETNQKELARVF